MKTLKRIYHLIEYTPLGFAIATVAMLLFTAEWVITWILYKQWFPVWMLAVVYVSYSIGVGVFLKRRRKL